MKYELTVTPDYVADWGVWEGLREIIQNAIDSESDGNPFNVYFEEDTVTVKQQNVRLTPKTLLLGSTSKRGSRYLGQFGEGYKLAMLALIRSGVHVRVIQPETLWTADFAYSEKYGSEILVINEEPYASDFDGLIWEVSGISDEAVEEFKSKVLADRSERVIDGSSGNIFVGGLFVASFSSLKFSYNFAPGRIRLNRDRNMTLNYEMISEIGELLPTLLTSDKLLEGCIEQVPDFEGLTSKGHMYATLGREWAKRYPETVPVVNEKQIAELKTGVKYKVVNSMLAYVIRSVIDFTNFLGTKRSPREKLISFKNKVQMKLTKDELNELLRIIEEIE